jgi:cellulose synthase/poly-beta-1,6-N-acetylglucosamine synthase-like glycosyltransferase
MTILFFIIFFFLSAYYFYFLFRIFSGLNNLNETPDTSLRSEFISIIIPFRNEAQNILPNLESIENLDYPEDRFEVVYIDDNSTDNSFNLIKEKLKKENIKVFKLPGELSTGNKKRAVNYGIDNSKGEIIVTTDADCVYHRNWLKHLLQYIDAETAFVSGPVSFKDGKSIFSKIQKLEFEGLILAGAGLIGSGKPVICNGANIAYKREAFRKVGGFKDNLNLASGDDELLMQKIFGETDFKIKFCVNREAVVFTNSNESIGGFFNQRKRWASKSLRYQDGRLISELILIFMFYLGLILQPLLILDRYYTLTITFIFSIAIKLLLEFLIIKKGEKLLFNKNSQIIFLLSELFQVPYIIISSITGLFGNFIWKDRRIKR